MGINFFTKLLTFLLDNYRNYVMSLLIGLMKGSLNKIWPWQNITKKNNSIIDHQMIPVFPQNYNGGDPEMNKAIVFLILGFIFSASTIWNSSLMFLQPYAWIIGAFVGAVIYYLLAKE